MEIEDYIDKNRLYTLSNGDGFYSTLPREYIEYLLYIHPNIRLHEIQHILEYGKDDCFEPMVLFSLQYRLFQACQEIKTSLKMNLAIIEYKYGFEKNPNFYVPCFYLERKMKKQIAQIKELISDTKIQDFVFSIKELLRQINSKNYHVGLLTEKNIKEENPNIYASIISNFTNYNVELIDDENPLCNFRWDDSIHNTVTVLIDVFSNKKRTDNILNSFFTMDEEAINFIGSRIIYTSFFYDDDFITGNLDVEWKKIEDNPFYLFPLWIYYPTSVTEKIDERDWWIRKLIWNFKYDSIKTSYEEKEKANTEVMKMIQSTLICSFGTHVKDLAFFCIPASTCEKYNKRFRTFSAQLCQETSMINCFDHIKYVCDSVAKHNGGFGLPYVEFNKEFFKGKNVILFDDIYTSGKMMSYYADILSSLGAKVIAGISIGITEKDKWSEEIEYSGYKGLYEYNSENLW